jgi:hypothetical protein
VSISDHEALLTLTFPRSRRAASTSLPSHQAIRLVLRTNRPTTTSQRVLHAGTCSFPSFTDLTIGLSTPAAESASKCKRPRASAVTTSRTVYASTLPPAPASLPPRLMFQNSSHQAPFPTLQFMNPQQITMYHFQGQQIQYPAQQYEASLQYTAAGFKQYHGMLRYLHPIIKVNPLLDPPSSNTPQRRGVKAATATRDRS